jgi:hypothetical protein
MYEIVRPSSELLLLGPRNPNRGLERMGRLGTAGIPDRRQTMPKAWQRGREIRQLDHRSAHVCSDSRTVINSHVNIIQEWT